MLRSLYLLALAASCHGGGSKPPAAGSGSASGAATAPSSPGLARSLGGPFTSLDAYCATRPTIDHTCEAADATAPGALPAGLLQVAAIYETNDGPNHDLGCAVALRTSAGWFVGPASAETCREPSYLELEALDVDTDGALAAITFDLRWHTKDGDDEAKYKLTAVCGVGYGGTPACTPAFLSQCDVHAPVSGCADQRFELTWTVDGDRATFKRDRAIDNATVPAGTQTILGR